MSTALGLGRLACFWEWRYLAVASFGGSFQPVFRANRRFGRGMT